MSRLPEGEIIEECGCRHDGRSYVPTARHPRLGMCDVHRQAWRAIHLGAAAEHSAPAAPATTTLNGRPNVASL